MRVRIVRTYDTVLQTELNRTYDTVLVRYSLLVRVFVYPARLAAVPSRRCSGVDCTVVWTVDMRIAPHVQQRPKRVVNQNACNRASPKRKRLQTSDRGFPSRHSDSAGIMVCPCCSPLVAWNSEASSSEPLVERRRREREQEGRLSYSYHSSSLVNGAADGALREHASLPATYSFGPSASSLWGVGGGYVEEPHQGTLSSLPSSASLCCSAGEHGQIDSEELELWQQGWPMTARPAPQRLPKARSREVVTSNHSSSARSKGIRQQPLMRHSNINGSTIASSPRPQYRAPPTSRPRCPPRLDSPPRKHLRILPKLLIQLHHTTLHDSGISIAIVE